MTDELNQDDDDEIEATDDEDDSDEDDSVDVTDDEDEPVIVP